MPVPVNPPEDDLTVYSVMGSPPSEDGGEKEILASPDPPRAVDTPNGAEGTVAGVTESDGSDGSVVPTELVAVTVNV